MSEAELEARVSLARIRTRAMDRNDGKASAMDDRDDLLARLDAAAARERALREALGWALRNSGGECPADSPAGYAKALRTLLAEPTERG